METNNIAKTWVVLKNDDFYSVHLLKEGQRVPKNAIRVIKSDDFSTLEIGDRIKFRDNAYYEFKDDIREGIIEDVKEENSQLYGKEYCICIQREGEFDERIMHWSVPYYNVNDILEIVDFSLEEYDVKDNEGKSLHVGDVVSYFNCLLTFEGNKKPTGTILEVHPYKNVVRARFKNENTGKWFERTMLSNWVKLIHSEA